MKQDLTASHRDPTDVGACTCANLRQAARAVTQAYDAALQPAGLRATQFTLLAMLARRGDMAVTGLAEAMVMDRTTLTRNLQPLIRKGLVRIGHEKDRRVRVVSLTAAGRRAFEAARPRWERAQSRIVERLGPVRWSGFVDDLAATVAVLRGR